MIETAIVLLAVALVTSVVLIVVRHGRTASNAAGRLLGRADPPLDDVRARTFEVGIRGRAGSAGGAPRFSLALFTTRSRDDIIFISAGPIVDSGRARMLAVATETRLPSRPDVPTFAEAGLPGLTIAEWCALFAPAGTPPEIVSRISADVGAILREEAMAARILAMGAVPDPRTPAQFGTFVREEIAKWREVARAGNVRLEG